MKKSIDMLNGDIKKSLFLLSVPIILSNLIQTLLGLVDMIWIGRVGAHAVSAIGTAGFYINIATALTTIIAVGTGVKISHSLGKGDHLSAQSFIKNGLLLSLIISATYIITVYLLTDTLIAYFGMNNLVIENMAKDYLQTNLVGVPFLFLVTILVTIMTSYGDTKSTFIANSIGLTINIILDPILIFGLWVFPEMGVIGAAWATNISRMIILVILLYNLNEDIRKSIKSKFDMTKALEVIKLSLPVTIQRLVFIYISIVMAKVIVQFGTNAIAVQKIGVQIEAVSYVTIGGLQGAIAAFIGQNYGNHNFERIKKSYSEAIKLVLIFGTTITVLFLIFSREIFSIFISDPNVISDGVSYMNAIAYSQLFMCIELLTVGAFNGIGKTYIPPFISIVLTALRIPLAIFLSSHFGLIGVWISISITSILKGIVLYVLFKIHIRKGLESNEELSTI